MPPTPTRNKRYFEYEQGCTEKLKRGANNDNKSSLFVYSLSECPKREGAKDRRPPPLNAYGCDGRTDGQTEY